MKSDFSNCLWAQGDVEAYLNAVPKKKDWVFADVIPSGTVTLIAGAGGTSKSFFMLHLAAHLAVGKSFGPYRPKKAGKSLLLMAEEDRDDIHRRIEAVKTQCEFDESDVNAVIENLGVVSVRGSDFRLVGHDLSGTLCETPRVSELIRDIQAIPNLRMLVLDPLVAFNGARENDNVDMAHFMRVLDRIASQTGAAVIVVHHVSKSGQTANLEDASQSVVRGASALVDNVRSAVLLTKLPPKDAGTYNIQKTDASRYIVVRIVKSNYGPSKSDAVFEVVDGGALQYIPEFSAQSLPLSRLSRPTNSSPSTKQLLCEMINHPEASQRQLAEIVFFEKSHVQRLQRKLYEDGYLRKVGNAYEVTSKGRKYAADE